MSENDDRLAASRTPVPLAVRASATAAPIVVLYGSGVLAGLLLRASAAPHGTLPAIVVVLTTAAAFGFAVATRRR